MNDRIRKKQLRRAVDRQSGEGMRITIDAKIFSTILKSAIRDNRASSRE